MGTDRKGSPAALLQFRAPPQDPQANDLIRLRQKAPGCMPLHSACTPRRRPCTSGLNQSMPRCTRRAHRRPSQLLYPGGCRASPWRESSGNPPSSSFPSCQCTSCRMTIEGTRDLLWWERTGQALVHPLSYCGPVWVGLRGIPTVPPVRRSCLDDTEHRVSDVSVRASARIRSRRAHESATMPLP